MEELNNTILIVFIVFIVSLGAFFGSVATSSSANETNITNNSSNKTNDSVVIMPMASGFSPQVSLSVSSPINLGTEIPDGLENSYPSITQVNASASEWFTTADDRLNLYVRASGNFINGNETIPLANFKYDGYGNSTLPKTSFTTNNVRVQSWPLGGSWIFRSVSRTVYGNYYLTIPMGSAEGTYTTTIYYTAILE